MQPPTEEQECEARHGRRVPHGERARFAGAVHLAVDKVGRPKRRRLNG